MARAAADTRLALGDEVRIPPVRVAERAGRPAAPAREFQVVHEDGALLCIDKPAGVAVHGGSGESFGVIEQLRRARPGAFLELVHRLDKETSGLLLVAKTRPALVTLQNDLRSRQPGRAVAKTYAALVIGDWPEALKVIDVVLRKDVAADGSRHVRVVGADDERGRRSISTIRVARRLAGFSLLDVGLKTGRTHQIRVHLADAGHAIAGDPKYGDFALNRSLARGTLVPSLRFDRMFLHARRLRFVHPTAGTPIELEAPLPAACNALLDALAERPG
jgi:23S rRNA pseudouridine955/2504/2580 synthase